MGHRIGLEHTNSFAGLSEILMCPILLKSYIKNIFFKTFKINARMMRSVEQRASVDFRIIKTFG